MLLDLVHQLVTRFNALSQENKELKAKLADQDAAIAELKQALDQFSESGNE